MLVLDGNLKNQQEVCMAKDAGFTEFAGLPGLIRTGCPRTPAFKCRYCTEHMNQACTSQPECGSAESSEEGESIIEVILAKKVTCSETYYQVRRTN